VDDFLSSLINYNKENIPEVCQRAIQPYLHDKEFDPEFIRSKSQAAAGLCAWVINIMKFYEVFCEVCALQTVIFAGRFSYARHSAKPASKIQQKFQASFLLHLQLYKHKYMKLFNFGSTVHSTGDGQR